MNALRIKILVLLSEGYEQKEIAAKLEMPRLNYEVKAIKRELTARTMEQAVRIGIKKGYIVEKS